jgi:exodeoxyribonuclease VII small subunit
MTDTSIKDFEAAIAELETIVKRLEEGDLPLSRNRSLLRRGVQLLASVTPGSKRLSIASRF